MKWLPLVSFVLTASALRAADPALPEFNSSTLGHPPLSLSDIVKGATNPRLFQFGTGLPSHALPTVPRPNPRKVTRSPGGMPILEPDSRVDYKLIVKAPDSSVDFKLIVKAPPVEREE